MKSIISPRVTIATLFVGLAVSAWSQDYRIVTGYTRLLTRLNGYQPDGESVTLGQS